MDTRYIVAITRCQGSKCDELYDQFLTADQVIDLMVELRSTFPAPVEEEEPENVLDEPEEEDVEDNEDTVRAGKYTLRKHTRGRGCGNCGKPGHNRKTCPELNEDPVPVASRAKFDLDDDSDLPIYYQDVLDMLRDGLSSEEIYEKMRYSITDAQFRTAMEWAELQ